MHSRSTVLLAIAALRCPAGFMTRQWYPPETAEALRKELLAAAQQEKVIAAARQTMVQVGPRCVTAPCLARAECRLCGGCQALGMSAAVPL